MYERVRSFIGSVFWLHSTTRCHSRVRVRWSTCLLVLGCIIFNLVISLSSLNFCSYWKWAYWINFFGWVLRSLIINEYTTSKYDEPQDNGLTLGENILIRFGFTDGNGDAYTSEWIW